MMSPLTPLVWIVILLPLFALAYFKSEKIRLKYLLIFFAYFLADNYIQLFSRQYFNLDFMHLKFGWVGKLLSLLLALGFIFFVAKKDRKEIGFTTETNLKPQVKFGVLVFAGILAIDFLVKFMLFPKGGEFDLETFLFQATMPGLTEELVFRGIYFWLLDKAFVPQRKYRGVYFGWGFIIVTLLFGIGHGAVLTTDYQLKFDWITIIYLTVISSLSLGLLRKFSGNLIYPIVGHNIINLMNVVIRIL